ncbi:MAG TPA: ABC transporter permease [Xanthobacteraceae bacterium]|jgi:ABC-type polysaccharide/polyol phosphate export permease
MLDQSARRPSIAGDDRRLRLLVTTGSEDLLNGLRRYDLWGRLGLLEVKRRYRRTVIGPFWSAISLGVFVTVMGSVGVGLWKLKAVDYVPFLASGMMVWLMISAMITESCTLFISTQHFFSRTRMDYSILAYALIWRNLVGFLHNLAVYFLVVLVFAPKLIDWLTLLAVPGLFLVFVNGAWLALLLGMACVRFRDIQQLIVTVLQISLFVTPVFWPPDLLTGTKHLLFVDINPLYSFVDVVRSPLLGKAPALVSYEVIAVVTIVGWTLTFNAFSRLRKRIVYWV